jgi:surface antigen
MVEVDPVTVALAMDNSEFLGSPMITTTQITNQPTPAPTTPQKRTTTITYTVDPGDTISSIGWSYGLKVATIKGANNLSSDTIKAGQKLSLPPQDLDPAALAKLKVKRVAGTTSVHRPPGSKSNAYPYGWCTYYVATRRYVPGHWGNARSWLSSARSSGYPTGSEPAIGAIVVTSESWMGHVAYVEAVNGSAVTIAEMNYRGWGIVDRRVIAAHAGMVMGYIY